MSPIDSSGKEDRSIHADFDYVDTQPLDIDSEEDDACADNEWRYFEDTVPFDDDDILETEAVNLAGETQALDDGETQLLEEESESVRTQVLENVDDEVSVDGIRCGDSDSDQVVDRKKSENSSGSMPPRFTFLRAESLRQAALANRNKDLKQTQNETNSVKGTSQFCQESLGVKDNGGSFPRCSEKVGGVDWENKHGEYSVEIGGFKSKSMCKVANSTVRKLFNDDLPVETNGPSLRSNDFNEEDNLNTLPINHGELEGLSYINSQEPGVLSQVNALDFVDRFLKDNIMEFDQETNSVKNMEEKSNSIPSTKGQHSLAKKVNDRGKAGRTGIYDWDDNHEDEGGGDIYLRRKEDFFKGETHGPRSLPGFRKSKVCRLNDDKEDEKQLSIPNKRKTAVHSDSRHGMHILKVRDNIIQEAPMKLKRNLANELDEQFNADFSRGEMEPKANAGVQEMLDVGLDTQMAAEVMEALCNCGDIVDHVANDASHVTRSGFTYKLNNSSTGKVGLVSSKERSGQYDRKRKVDVKSKLQTSGLSKKSTKEVKQCKKDNMMARSKRSKLNAEDNQTSSANENGRVSLSTISAQRMSTEALKRHQLDELNNPDGNNGEGGGSPVNKRQLQDDVWHFTPVARRTRRSLAEVSKALNSKSTTGSSDHFEVDDNSKLCQFENSALKASTVSVSDDVEIDTLDCPKRRRSLRIRKLPNNDKGSVTLVGSSKPSAQPIGKSTVGKRKMRIDSVVKSHVNCQAHSSLYDGSVISSIDQQGKISELNLDKANPGDNINISKVTSSDESPKERYKSSDLASATPAKCKTPANDASPVCMGDEYYKQSCNRNRSRSCLLNASRKELRRELQSLSAIRPELLTPSKDSRKRRDMSDVRILYSHHLDEDIIKHQKKILARLGVSVASSIADATHFIADQFVRTRNMLEAIAFGKPVVTHLWIESCGQASCFIDERNNILRDARKEKELGFSMPVSLARAIQHPLLKGRRVLITPNTKPSKEIISNLARAVQGQVVEKVGRSVLKGHKIPDDLLILSCEEDYASCVPFLEKGAMVYSSELLLNGIVTQKLEYQRHRLFADNVKKTRSTLWLKRDDRTFVPVTKCN
ncbi:PAX-interacting protein 1, partial [Mucuna pruriens]